MNPKKGITKNENMRINSGSHDLCQNSLWQRKLPFRPWISKLQCESQVDHLKNENLDHPKKGFHNCLHLTYRTHSPPKYSGLF